jgi:hypothetical protein
MISYKNTKNSKNNLKSIIKKLYNSLEYKNINECIVKVIYNNMLTQMYETDLITTDSIINIFNTHFDISNLFNIDKDFIFSINNPYLSTVQIYVVLQYTQKNSNTLFTNFIQKFKDDFVNLSIFVNEIQLLHNIHNTKYKKYNTRISYNIINSSIQKIKLQIDKKYQSYLDFLSICNLSLS